VTARPRPGAWEVDDDGRELRVDWDDGHRSAYPARTLRGWCPCAVCQGHHRRRADMLFHDVPGVTFDEMAPVGSYAVAFHFDDGHDTGIYSFEFLRGLCPCPDCGGEGPGGET